jgi:hypothetical protein
MNSKAKGTYNERKTINLFEKQGYKTIRAAGSKGDWDIIAWNHQHILFIQVKTRDWPGTEEMERLKQSPCPPAGKKLIYRWITGRREPDVREVH